LDLFSGIGGFALAARWTGAIETVAFCEREKYAQRVLKKHWPDVPICDDIHNLKGNEYGTVDIITGGFPCQPYSVAGERRGNEDDRALWPEMLRVIQTARPTWVLGENVPGIIGLALDGVLSDLEDSGYAVEAVCIPACGVDAKHRRERVWILAHTESGEDHGRERRNLAEKEGRREGGDDAFDACGQDVANAGGTRQQERDVATVSNGTKYCSGRRDEMVRHSAGEGLPEWAGGEVEQPSPITEFERPSGREIERDFRGVAHGVSKRVDRLKGLGNAIVPQVAFQILKIIMKIENLSKEGSE